MSDLSETGLRLYLIQGLQAEVSGDYGLAKERYLAVMKILASESAASAGYSGEKRKRQIATLQKAVDRLDSASSGPGSNGRRAEGLKILKEIGLEVVKKSGISISDVIGLEDVKKEILLRIIYPIKFRELSEEYNVSTGGGILLYGPPGNGKTFIARAIASEIDANFIYINPSVIYNQWFGNFEKNISAIFRAADRLSPSIVFFDEIDSMVPSRDRADSDVVRRGVSQFLNEMGGFSADSSREVFIMGATNTPWNIDPALTRPGRFDRIIYVPPPDSGQRAELFRKRVSAVRNTENIDVSKLSEATEGYSAADIDYVCRKAADEVFLEIASGGKKRAIRTEDYLNAIDIVKPSIKGELIRKYKEYSGHR